MAKITATKSKLYRLAKQHILFSGKMRDTTFIKYPRCRSYALDFFEGDCFYHIFFSVCGGEPMIGVKRTWTAADGTQMHSWSAKGLSENELLQFGLLEV